MADRPVTVAIVDDHRFLAQTLSIALRDHGFEPVIIGPEDGVVTRITDAGAGIVLLDLNLGSEQDGDVLIAPLSRDGHAVIVLTGETDAARWGDCLRAGAIGVLPKASPLDAVVTACSAAARGDAVVREADRLAWTRAADRHRSEVERAMAPFRALTRREQAVLSALVEGEQAATIAAKAVVSETTVRTQIRSLLTKLGVGSQLQAVARARQAGWTEQAC
jgi:two-component system nitrate/nitrite response regulator NarL